VATQRGAEATAFRKAIDDRTLHSVEASIRDVLAETFARERPEDVSA
jgi:hypothetical protein